MFDVLKKLRLFGISIEILIIIIVLTICIVSTIPAFQNFSTHKNVYMLKTYLPIKEF